MQTLFIVLITVYLCSVFFISAQEKYEKTHDGREALACGFGYVLLIIFGTLLFCGVIN